MVKNDKEVPEKTTVNKRLNLLFIKKCSNTYVSFLRFLNLEK